MTELEKSIYSAIDVLQKQIANDRLAISNLLDQLPCKYVITRTFIRDWSSHYSSVAKGHKQYYTGGNRGYSKFIEQAQFYRSLRDVEFVLVHCNAEESLKEYVELKIERIDK